LAAAAVFLLSYFPRRNLINCDFSLTFTVVFLSKVIVDYLLIELLLLSLCASYF